MPIDPSIPLQTQAVNPMGMLSSVLDIQGRQQQLRNAQQANQQGQQDLQQSQIALQEKQASVPILQNIKRYTNDQGAIDFDRLTPDIMSAAPTTGPAILSGVAKAQQEATTAKTAVFDLDQKSRNMAGGAFASLVDQPYDVVQNVVSGMKATFPAAAPTFDFLNKYIIGPNQGDQKTLNDHLLKASRIFLGTEKAQDANSPGVSFVPTQGGIQPYNTKAGVPGIPLGPMGAAMAPPNQTVTTTGGGTALANPATGQVSPLTPSSPTAPTVDFPAGENLNTQAELQLQRTSAQQTANQAPTMHNINRSIISLVDSGDVSSGKWGETMQKLRSATGFLSDKFGDPNATDTNLAGKMLERSALTAAQSMGPHTNAGLEAQVRANGSLEYTPQALRKIATLNDALTTGSTLYQAGLENVINGNGGGIFAKRQFDQQWTKAMNPSGGVDGVQALRLKNAVDAGDKTEIGNILKEVGGPNSKGAQMLFLKLQSIHQLAGDQQ